MRSRDHPGLSGWPYIQRQVSLYNRRKTMWLWRERLGWMQPQAKDSQEPPAAGRGGKDPPLESEMGLGSVGQGTAPLTP